MQIYHYLLFNKHSFSEFGMRVGFHMFEKSLMIMDFTLPNRPNFCWCAGKNSESCFRCNFNLWWGKLGPIKQLGDKQKPGSHILLIFSWHIDCNAWWCSYFFEQRVLACLWWWLEFNFAGMLVVKTCGGSCYWRQINPHVVFPPVPAAH